MTTDTIETPFRVVFMRRIGKGELFTPERWRTVVPVASLRAGVRIAAKLPRGALRADVEEARTLASGRPTWVLRARRFAGSRKHVMINVVAEEKTK